jgi:hypothetical protein
MHAVPLRSKQTFYAYPAPAPEQRTSRFRENPEEGTASSDVRGAVALDPSEASRRLSALSAALVLMSVLWCGLAAPP